MPRLVSQHEAFAVSVVLFVFFFLVYTAGAVAHDIGLISSTGPFALSERITEALFVVVLVVLKTGEKEAK